LESPQMTSEQLLSYTAAIDVPTDDEFALYDER
jgi:hypothetical protein